MSYWFLMYLKMKYLMKQFEVYIANLDPTKGTEINKTRPVVIVSPDEMNGALRTVIIAPITSQVHANIPTRIKFSLQDKISYVVLDQLRTLDKTRLYKHIANLTENDCESIKNTLIEMFS